MSNKMMDAFLGKRSLNQEGDKPSVKNTLTDMAINEVPGTAAAITGGAVVHGIDNMVHPKPAKPVLTPAEIMQEHKQKWQKTVGAAKEVGGDVLKGDLQGVAKKGGKAAVKFIKNPVVLGAFVAEHAADTAIMNVRGKNLAKQNGVEWKPQDTALAATIPFAPPDSIVRRKVQQQENLAKTAGENAFYAMLEKEAGIEMVIPAVAKLAPKIVGGVKSLAGMAPKAVKPFTQGLKNTADAVKDVGSTGLNLAKSTMNKSTIGADALNAAQGNFKNAVKTLGNNKGFQLGTASAIGYNLGSNKNQNDLNKLSEEYVTAMIEKQAALEVMAESDVIAQSAETALNACGYSMFEN